MEFDYYEEDQMQLLKDLAARTMAGTIEWKDIEYNPIAVLGTEKDDGTSEYVLTHMFSCTANLSGIIYDVEFSESIDLLTGKGDVFLTLVKTGAAGFDKIDVSLSGDPAYDDTPADLLREAYREYPALVLADVLTNRLHETDAVRETFEWASYTNQDIPEIIREVPIYQMGKKLFVTQNVIGFHRCIIETEYRSQFLNG